MLKDDFDETTINGLFLVFSLYSFQISAQNDTTAVHSNFYLIDSLLLKRIPNFYLILTFTKLSVGTKPI